MPEEEKCDTCRYFVTEQPEDKLGRCVTNPAVWSKCPSHLNRQRPACRHWNPRGLSTNERRFRQLLAVLRGGNR